GKGEYSFAAQIGIDVINKYLKTLFDRGYFQLCFTDFKFNEESKDCKELGFWGTRHRFGVKKAPYIGLDAQRGEHYIHIPEIERVSTVLMDVSLMNKCLSDVTNMSIRLRQSTAG